MRPILWCSKTRRDYVDAERIQRYNNRWVFWWSGKCYYFFYYTRPVFLDISDPLNVILSPLALLVGLKMREKRKGPAKEVR